jgi:hypothetical protein
MAELIHYSDAALGTIYSVEQHDVCHFKPRGLWVSVDGDEGLERLTHAHVITLADRANILRLSGAADLDAFTAEFLHKPYPGLEYRAIDWRPVAAKYQGIIIAPYIWERRLTDHAPWYYAWDCASGCIWDASAIKNVAAVELQAREDAA